jgi:hypothetical protein
MAQPPAAPVRGARRGTHAASEIWIQSRVAARRLAIPHLRRLLGQKREAEFFCRFTQSFVEAQDLERRDGSRSHQIWNSPRFTSAARRSAFIYSSETVVLPIGVSWRATMCSR